MKHCEKIQWMHNYCADNDLTLTLEGECGFGRECVGVLLDGSYPDYKWYDFESGEEDDNGEVWTPDDAYHKHPCVAVLGRGEKAEDQLYEWLKWFNDNNFKPEITEAATQPKDIISIMLGRGTEKRMVKMAS